MNDGVVVDASMAAAWLLPDERSDETDHVLSRAMATTRLVPSIFWHEFRNIVLMAVRRKRIDAEKARRSSDSLKILSLRDGGRGRDDGVLRLALARNLTAYDAAHLALAIESGAFIATLDRKMAAAARLEIVPLLGPLA